MDDRDPRVLWCGNLSESASLDVVRELFLQAGPVESVKIPKDKDGRQRCYGFITYQHEESVPYAVELFRGTRLYERTLNLQSKTNPKNGRQQQQQQQPTYYHPTMFAMEEQRNNETNVSSLQGQCLYRTKTDSRQYRFEPYEKSRSNKDYERDNRRNNGSRAHGSYRHGRNREKDRHGGYY